MRTSRRRSTAQPRFEALEDRRLMAGNVTAVIKGGTLTIRGDAADNQIIVMEYGNKKNHKTTITNTNGTVNGKKSLTFQSKLITKDVIADLTQGGDDRIYLGGLGAAVTTRNVKITTGKGNDSVALSNVTLMGGVAIDTGDGNDTVQLHQVGMPRWVDINTGAGDDRVIVYDGFFRGPVSVFLGDGKDGLSLSDVGLATTITADGGPGVDSIDTHHIAAGTATSFTGFQYERYF